MNNIFKGINEVASWEVTELLKYIMDNSNRIFDYYEQLEELFDANLVKQIELDQILLNDRLTNKELSAMEVIKPIAYKLIQSIKPEGKQYLNTIKKLTDEWIIKISPHLDRYIDRNFSKNKDVEEGQIYSTGGGAGQSYRKFVPKTDSSNESLIMKGIQREGKKGSKGKQQFDELTQQILDMIWQSDPNQFMRYLVFNPEVGIELDTNKLDDALEFAEEFAYNNPDSPTLVFDRQTNFPITSFNTMHEGYSAGASGGAGLGENKDTTAVPKRTVYVIYLKDEPVVKMADYNAVKELYDFMKGKYPNLNIKMVKKQSDMFESTKNNYKKLVEFLDSGDGDGDGDDDDLRQQVIEMYFEDGLKEQEIAEIVGITELKVNQIIDEYERGLNEAWSKKYKQNIDCNEPKGFSQKAHCAGRKARQSGKKTKSKSINK